MKILGMIAGFVMIEGFTGWKNLAGRLKEYEISNRHRDVCSLSLQAVSWNLIDKQMVSEYKNECKFQQSILRSVAAMIHLTDRRIQLFAEDETVESVRNGQFLESWELIATFNFFCILTTQPVKVIARKDE